jgi:proteasome beta subunit
MKLKKWQLLQNKEIIKMTDKIKTGTSCVGLVYKDGVILAADRRMTAGFIATDSTIKVYELASNILATTAGGAAANQLVMRHMKGEIKTLELKCERRVRVKEAAMILNSIQYSIMRSQGEIVSCILGGFDIKPHLYNLSPDGTIIVNDGYVADGSGSIYMKPVLDNDYKPNMNEKEALVLVEKAFKSSFRNDNMSGGGYIVKIVDKNGINEIDRKKVESKLVNVKENFEK